MDGNGATEVALNVHDHKVEKDVHGTDKVNEKAYSSNAATNGSEDTSLADGKAMKDKPLSQTPGSFKAPPVTFKLPSALPKASKNLEEDKSNSEKSEKTPASAKDKAEECIVQKETISSKTPEAIISLKRKSAVATLTPAQKVGTI